MRKFWVILTLVILARSVAAEELPSMAGQWKVVSVAGDNVSGVSELQTMTFVNGRVDFKGPSGSWAANIRFVPRADATQQMLLDGPEEINGGDLSFIGAATLSFQNGLARIRWTSFGCPKLEEKKVKVDMWLEKLPDIEKELQGEWSVVWSSIDGVVTPHANKTRWVLDRRDLVIVETGKVHNYVISVKNDVVPSSFMRTTISFDDKNLMRTVNEQGILEHRSDGKLWIALVPPSAKPPTNFVSRQGSKVALFVLERNKDR